MALEHRDSPIPLCGWCTNAPPLLSSPLRCVSLDSISVALSLSLHIDNVVQADWEDVSERDSVLGRSLQVDGPQSKDGAVTAHTIPQSHNRGPCYTGKQALQTGDCVKFDWPHSGFLVS